MQLPKVIVALGLALALAAPPAGAAVLESFTFTDVGSWDGEGDSNNDMRSHTATTSSTANYIRWSGVADPVYVPPSGIPPTWGMELSTTLTTPSGSTALQLGSGQGFPAGTSFSGAAPLGGTVISAGDTLSFEFWESFDDEADAMDAEWQTITFDLLAVPTQQQAGTLLSGAVDWFSFTLCDNVSAANGDLLALDTEGSTFDTELGLYDAAGQRIADDDDGGSGLLSILSFGSGGRHGDLAAGTYYLAIGAFDTVFGADNFDVSTTSSGSGAYTINLASTVCASPLEPVATVPEPGSLLLLGSGLLGLTTLRRRQRRS